jgi:hypothetical protein
MHRTDAPGATVDGHYQDGNPVEGILASVVGDDAMNALQDELCAVVEQGGGLALNKADNTQVLQAIRKMFDLYLPLPLVFMFDGPINTIPANFRLCNGLNGTRNLQDRFIVGAGGSYTLGSTGGALNGVTAAGGAHTPTMQIAGAHSHTSTASGAHSHSTNVQGDHSHTLTIDGTTLSINQMPPHTHTVDGSTNSNNTPGGFLTSANSGGSLKTSGSAGGGQSHTHSGGTAAAGGHSHTTDVSSTHQHGTDSQGGHTHAVDPVGNHTHTFSNTPPYYAMAFIMRVAS